MVRVMRIAAASAADPGCRCHHRESLILVSLAETVTDAKST